MQSDTCAHGTIVDFEFGLGNPFPQAMKPFLGSADKATVKRDAGSRQASREVCFRSLKNRKDQVAMGYRTCPLVVQW